ncbi:hypothetical protein [Luteolibacter sp. AS25]|uniref:hypothetical protein n=1 Tax=Luteolibacter sp. AS25 TaxID=3135776 RepID=UPI00398A7508
MKPYQIIFFAFLFVPIQLKADPPSEPSPTDYSVILTRNPFGSTGEKQESRPVAPTKTSSYELQGVTKMADGWLIVIANKANRTQQMIIREGANNPDNIVLKNVATDRENYMKATALIAINGAEQEVRYNLEATTAAMNTAAKPSDDGKKESNDKDDDDKDRSDRDRRGRPDSDRTEYSRRPSSGGGGGGRD